MPNNRRIVLAGRPAAEVTPDNFRLETVETPPLADGQLLVRNEWLSLDPYMRGRMNEGRSYAQSQPLDETMIGGTAGRVVESRHPKFKAGDAVVGYLGWQEYGVSDGAGLFKADTTHIPLSAYLGAVGMPGVTAWYGLNRIIEPKAGETIVVSAASGAVGGVVGQLAKLAGCRAVGIAGGREKCDHVVDELKFDACIDYKRQDVGKALKEAAPQGVDGYFENVGGEILEAVLPRMNAFGRIALCGLIAGYNAQPIPIRNPTWFLISRLKLQGFIVSEHMEVWPQALKELGQGVASGRIRYRETVAQGLQSAPEAFIGLLKGRNFGKQLVRLA
ncbi:MAG: NADP-dependent oxidoreductase [Burkholderiaceae bacterium]|nr:NADP-dependent oxidoreductase [Burkholderiaceae bacterium]